MNYEEIFSLVSILEIFISILTLVSHFDLTIYQMDVKLSFLNGESEEEFYVHKPKWFTISSHEDKVYKLKKALCGLKQAPRAWYSRIDTYFHKNYYHRYTYKDTLYVKVRRYDFIIIYLYVDDIILMSSSTSMLKQFKIAMLNEFKMIDLGEMEYFFSVQVK